MRIKLIDKGSQRKSRPYIDKTVCYSRKTVLKRLGVWSSFITIPHAFKQCPITLLIIHSALYKVLKEKLSDPLLFTPHGQSRNNYFSVNFG
jgi:hypothetical protein